MELLMGMLFQAFKWIDLTPSVIILILRKLRFDSHPMFPIEIFDSFWMKVNERDQLQSLLNQYRFWRLIDDVCHQSKIIR